MGNIAAEETPTTGNAQQKNVQVYLCALLGGLMRDLLRGHFCANLHEILAPGLKLNFMTTLFHKIIILTNRFHVNDPSILAQKQQKVAIFHKTDFWGL